MGALTDTLQFLIRSVFDIYILVILLRFFFHFFQVNFNNPISQFVIKLTAPFVHPLQSLVPRVKTIDTATLLFAFIVTLLKLIALGLSGALNSFSLHLLVILAIMNLLKSSVSIFFYAILIRVVLSWFPSTQAGVVLDVVHQLTEPFLSRVRRVIPLLGGLDLSPLIALILLQAAAMLLLGMLVGLL